MLLRDRLRARIAEMGDSPDHQRLAAEVLGIRNAPPDLARRLVSQALVVEDRRAARRPPGGGLARQGPGTARRSGDRAALGRPPGLGEGGNTLRRERTPFAGGGAAGLHGCCVRRWGRNCRGAPVAQIGLWWLACRGASATRLDPREAGWPRELRARLPALLADGGLFAERIVLMSSKFRARRSDHS